jgi:hypothetical protein
VLNLKRWLFKHLRSSARIHLRSAVGSLKEAIDVVDRFIDGHLNYPMEWDDFISWEHPIRSVENMRRQVANMERQLLAKAMPTRREAVLEIIRIRDHHAGLIGISPRDKS